MVRWSWRQRTALFAILTVIEVGWCVGLSATEQAVGLIGRSIPVPSTITTPCDLVALGCAAAYDVQVRVVANYTGPLFQLIKTGGTTQDIGQIGTNVDKAAINTFCGNNNANGCGWWKIYNQSAQGSANDLLCSKASLGAPTSLCTVAADALPFTWIGSWGSAPTPSNTGTNSGNFLNASAPTGVPSGSSSASVVLVGNDHNVSSSASWYEIDGGLFHHTEDPDNPYTNFGATLRANTGGTGEWRYFGCDCETQSVEAIYGQSGTTTYSNKIDDVSDVGDFVGAIVYDSSSGVITADFNHGQRSYSKTIGVTPNWGGGKTTQIRVQAGGDSTRTPGILYGFLVFNGALSSVDYSTVEAAEQSLHGISSYNCNASSATNTIDLAGQSNTYTAYGLRVLNRHVKGPQIGLYRTSDMTYKVIGSAPNTCDFDVATASAFCMSTTCYAYEAFNQTPPMGHSDLFGTNLNDPANLFAPSLVATNGPTLVFNCLGSFACLDTSSGSLIPRAANLLVTRPYTVSAVAEKTSGSTYAAIWGDNSSANAYFGAGPSASTINFYASATGFEQIAGLVNNTWYGLAGAVPTTTTITACASSNGSGVSCMTASGQTTTDLASAALSLGHANGGQPFTGRIMEVIEVNGTALSNGNMTTGATEQCSYWGFTC